MAIKAYVPFEQFKLDNPVLNYSSRVYLLDPFILIYDLSVSDGTIVNGYIYDLTVSDAEATGDLIPDMGYTPTFLVFADTDVDESAPTRTVTITNIGTAPLTITEISVSGDFTLESIE
jgi:hypothetical protein